MSTVVFYIHFHQGTFTRFFFFSSTLGKLPHGDSWNFSSNLSNFASPTKPKRFETNSKDDREIIYILMSRRLKKVENLPVLITKVKKRKVINKINCWPMELERSFACAHWPVEGCVVQFTFSNASRTAILIDSTPWVLSRSKNILLSILIHLNIYVSLCVCRSDLDVSTVKSR